MNKEKHLDEVRKFIIEERGRYRFELQDYHSLQSDLGIYGMDASEFIMNFSNKFGVDVSSFDVDKYFRPEGYGYTDEGYSELTIADLIMSLETGVLS
ncbi:DUF1493 family protein [Flavobacterium salilacus subsp. salilacus]|uniref:DUF1493 family protein n=1 Tax=Flavobacterium TaxID=237 RepID=UPI00107506CA|nr:MULTISPECIES: DUF1493 family protein [Flavobacterium]KAF2514155.1 DUF1493 family protein [Flavobacterium salilacus subsp. salilacus]MBE1615185.1 DUF1493 family protein [Flavobacterium sp. SaA2.13]